MSDIDIGYGLDPSGYLAGVSAIEAGNARLQTSFGQTVTTSGGVSRALSMVTPGRATLAAMGLLSQQAAQAQQALAGLQATSTVTDVKVGKLAKGIREMARDMPLGSQGSRQLVEQFTRMGVAGEGSEKKIVRLSTAVAKLSGATGENAGALAQGMTDLARATGNTKLDPKRFEDLGDALTTVSAKSGASATSILAFSKNIAPMAQASGIGATGVLGISSAFARLGDDGLAAQTAITKMLSDMNRAVREGSPEMKTYAQFVGKSADDFERLYKSNPAEALTQVTEAISKSGSGGPRMLEQIGVEGIRGQRSLQRLVASGGLRSGIEQAQAGYGSGSTETAANAAFSTLTDSMSQLGEATQQVAEAFGTPLLAPLTTFADTLTKITGGIGEMAASKPAQKVGSLAVDAGIAFMVVKGLLAPLATLMLGRQIGTSGPLRAAAAGYVDNMTGTPGRRLGIYAAPLSAAEARINPRTGLSDLRSGPVGRLRGWQYDFGAGLARRGAPAVGPIVEPTTRPLGAPGFLAKTASTVNAYGSNLTGSAFSMYGQQAFNASAPAMERRTGWGLSSGFQGAWAAGKGAMDGRGWSALPEGAKAFNAQLLESTKGMKGLNGATGEAIKGFKETAKFTGTIGKDGVRAFQPKQGGLSSGVLGGMGGMLAMTAVTTAFMAGKNNMESAKQERADFLDKDVSGTINAYRESIGKATDATVTFGSLSEQMSKNLAASAKLGTFSEAKQVTDADWAASRSGKIVRNYAGSADEIAAQIRAASPTGVTTDELQAIKVDLGRQVSRDTVQQVMDKLPATFEAGPDSGMGRDQMAATVKTVAGAAGKSDGGFWANTLNALGGTNNLDSVTNVSRLPGWLQAVNWGPGGGLHPSSLTDASKAQLGAVSEGIGQQYSTNLGKFQSGYAEQERGKSANAALKAVYDSGNADAWMKTSTDIGASMDPKLKDKVWSPEEFKAAGYDFTKMVADASDSYKSTREQADKDGAKFTGTGGMTPELIEQAYTKGIRQQSALLGDAFDVRSKSSAAVAMSASLASPADAGKQVDAMNAMVTAADKAGTSMSDLAIQAAKSAQGLGETTDAFARMKAIQARAEFEMSSRGVQSGATEGDQQVDRMKYYTQLASIHPTTEAEESQRQDAQAKLLGEIQGAKARMVARLQVQRQADIAAARANEDFQRQQEYSKHDYEVQVFRLERNYRISSGRATFDFNRQQARAEEDFNLSRLRTLQDFHTAAKRSEQDYQLSRTRQLRDFNISLARQIEDAAKSMYDPYSRIQTKATWDTKNLLVNMQQQTQAIAKQKSQLDELRKMGLSAQAIDQLGLGKTENAQQLNNIMADANPANIAALNAAAQDRAQATGSLYTDSSNIDLKRSKEDFNRSLKDQEIDFQKSVQRQREDLNKSLKRSADDFAKAATRARADFKLSLVRSRTDLNTTLADMATDRKTAMSRAKTALDVQLGRMAEDIKNADQTIAGNMSDLAEQVNRAIHGKAVKWQGILKADTGSWVTKMQSDVIPKVKAAFTGMGLTVSDVNAAYQPGGSVYNSQVPSQANATGGPIRGYSPNPKADNVLVRATAGEWMHPVDSVQYYGPGFMEKVRTKSFPRELALQGLANGGMVYKQMEAWLGKNIPSAVVTSDYRDPARNARVGGSRTSMHLQGKAVDLAPSMGTFNKILSAFGSKIYQLFYSPADGRTILKGQPFRMGASLKADHWDHVHWAMQSMNGLAGAAGVGGGVFDPAVLSAIFAKAPHKAGIQGALTSHVYAALLSKLTAMAGAGAIGELTASFAGGSGVSQWADEVTKVLTMLGRGQGEKGAVLRRIQLESGGNPRAINLTDSNARAGTPSKGLMQVIAPTFQAYRSRALPNQIYDPMANIYAGSNYAVKRYGSLAAIDPKVKPGGYDSGGRMDPGYGIYHNGTRKPEAVLTSGQWDKVSKLVEDVSHLVTGDQLRGVNTAAGAHIVVNNSQTYHYDSGAKISDSVFKVEANDPNKLFDALQAKATTDRVAQTRGVRRGP